MHTTDKSTADLLRETAERLMRDHCDAAVLRAAEQGDWPAAAWNAVEAAGLHRALLPETAGGFGLSATDALVLLRVAGEHALPLPLAETLLAGWLLAEAGLPVPDGPLTLAPVVAGESLELIGDRLHGRVSRVPWGRHAAAIAVLAKQGAATRVALVARPNGPATTSWHVTAGENIAREPRDSLEFDGVPAQVGSALVGPARVGSALIGFGRVGPTEVRALGAALRSQQMAGALVRLCAMTTQYAQDRVQFGRPIGKFQAVQQNLAVLAGQAAAAVAAADLASEAIDDGLRLLPIGAAKARTGEAAGIGSAIAHQVHGAIGFTFEHSLHNLTRRLWSWRDEFGNETEWNQLIGRHLVQAGADRLWPALTEV